MIKDSGFQGDGSLFTSRFEANAPLYASQLNSLAAGIQTALVMPYLGEGPQISYTSSGTIVTNHPAPPAYTGTAKLVPWTVEVQTETDGETTNYFLRTVRGICNYTWSEFPFSPKTTTTSGLPYLDLNGNRVYDNECIVTDYAVYPSGSYREGTESTSGWMGGNAAIQIKNESDGGSDVWYVTVSKLDWWNKFNWNDADRLQDKERPWVSVFAEGSEADTKILKPTQNSFSLHRLFLPQAPFPVSSPQSTDTLQGNVVAKHIGYDVKKVAAIIWEHGEDPAVGNWVVVQYILHQVEIAIPYQQQTIWDYFIWNSSPPVNDYQYAVDAHFVGSIDNLTLRSGLSSITGYTINSDNWWYDIIANTTPR